MADFFLMRWLKALLGIAISVSISLAACLSSAAAIGLVAYFLSIYYTSLNWKTAFFLGFFLPLFFAHRKAGSPETFEKQIKRWGNWVEAGYLTRDEFEMLRREAVRTYGIRQYGKDALGAGAETEVARGR